MSNILEAAKAAAKKKADEKAAAATAQAKQAASNFSDPLIDSTKKVADMAAKKVSQIEQAALQAQADKVKNQPAEAACKSAVKLESQLKDNVKEITLFPEKLPMNLTESLNTKVGKVAGLNKSEMTIEVQGGKFAKTAWLGRSTDAVGVEDTYGIKDSSVVNKAENTDLTVAAVAIKKYIMGEGDLKDDLPSIVKDPENTFNLSPSALADRVKSALGGSSPAMNRLGSTLMKETFSGSLDGAARALMSTFQASLDGVTSQFNATNIPNVQALFEGINRITKQSDFAQYFDVGAEAQLLTGLFSEAVALKMPGAMSALVEASSSDQAVNQALKNVLGAAVRSGDVDTISELAERLGPNQLLAINPEIAMDILSNYKIKSYTPQLGLMLAGNALIALLNSVDPNWATVDRNGTQISNLFALHGMSEDARTVLSTLTAYRDLIAVAEYYGPESFSKSITSKYPMCPILA